MRDIGVEFLEALPLIKKVVRRRILPDQAEAVVADCSLVFTEGFRAGKAMKRIIEDVKHYVWDYIRKNRYRAGILRRVPLQQAAMFAPMHWFDRLSQCLTAGAEVAVRVAIQTCHLGQKAKAARRAVKYALRDMGWNWQQIAAAFDDAAEAIKEYS